MDVVAQYRTYAAEALKSAKQAKSKHEQGCFLVVAQGWIDVAATLSTILGAHVAPKTIDVSLSGFVRVSSS
jgi:hypothetical protein